MNSIMNIPHMKCPRRNGHIDPDKIYQKPQTVQGFQTTLIVRLLMAETDWNSTGIPIMLQLFVYLRMFHSLAKWELQAGMEFVRKMGIEDLWNESVYCLLPSVRRFFYEGYV